MVGNKAWTTHPQSCTVDGLDLFKSPRIGLNLPHENPSASRAGSEFVQAGALLNQKSILMTVLQTPPFPAEG